MASVHWKVSFVVVLMAILMGLESQIDYERICQVTCLEAEVDKYRVDPWDVLHIRSKLCALRGITACRNKFSMDNVSVHDNHGDYRMCRFEKKKKICFSIDASFQHSINVSEKWKEIRTATFYEVYLSVDIKSKGFYIQPTWRQKYTQRRIRFTFFDFLDIGLWREHHDLQLAVTFDRDIEAHLTENECRNLIILLLMKLNLDLQNTEVNLHTPVFDQSQVILSEGTRYYALIAICMNLLSIGLTYYFVYNFILSLVGPRKPFHFDPQHVPFSAQNLDRPDLICSGSNELNIFTCYFWKGILSDHGFIHSVVFVCLACCWIFYMLAVFTHFALLGDNVSILDQFPSIKMPWYFYKLDSFLPYFVVYVVPFFLVFMNTSIVIFFLFGFVLSLFIPEQLFDMTLILPAPHGFQWYAAYCFSVIFAVLFSVPFFFRNRKVLTECLNIQTLSKMFLWPTWPSQFFIFICLKAKKRFSFSSNAFLAVWTFFLISSFYVGIMHVPNRSIIGYWLFVPIFILLSELSSSLIINSRFQSYHKWISQKIWSLCFALCMTLFGVYTCNFYLFSLYPLLKEVKPGSSLLTLWIPIILHLTTYILEVWRSNYTMYETYLKAVLSYVKSRDSEKASDGIVRNKKRLENHNGDFVVVYRDGGQYDVKDDKIFVKGLLLFIRDGKCYIPGDFFFEVIKLPGGPGSIKSVLIMEIWDLFLRLFPAFFINWVRETIHIIEMESYDIMLQAILSNTLLLLYKGLFLHRKAKTFDVSGNIAMQVQIDQFVKGYQSWAFLSGK